MRFLEFPRLFHIKKLGSIKHSKDLDMLDSGSIVERSKFFAKDLRAIRILSAEVGNFPTFDLFMLFCKAYFEVV